MVNMMGIETEDLSFSLPRTVLLSFLFALISYDASLQINIVPQCKDRSIFCFDSADDLLPCKTIKSAKIRLENDGLLIPAVHS